jgi:FkbM family methyltransferase
MVKEMDLFLELTRNKNTLLDVGALHGVFSLAFTANHPNRTSLAVDASPFAFARLLYNIHSNPSCRILSSEAALSDHKTFLKMNYEWEHAVASRNQVDNQLTVQALTGDELCQTKSFFPDVIQIDVEGLEKYPRSV